ncbi:MAG: MFS transporter [Caldilineaceae bacterium]|nr:MFS transporter [Caldilineaceae bacterium]
MVLTKSAFLDSFSPLKNANFRTYLLGQGVSLIGTFMQQMALQWFIWEVTQDTRWVGIVAAVTFAPAFFLMPFTGAIADRVDRRKVLIATQLIEMTLALSLALLIFLGLQLIWPVLIFALILGIVAAFNYPTQGAFIGDLSGMGEIRKAMMLYAFAIEIGRFIGPALSGLIVAQFNTATAFLINGLSFIAVVISLLFVRAQQIRRPPSGNLLQNFGEALRYIRQQPRIADLLLCSLSVTLFIFSSLQLAAPIADMVLRGGPELVGYLLGASGAGALLGVLLVAPQIQRVERAGLALSGALLWSGLWLVMTSFFTWAPLTILGIFLTSVNIPVVLAGVGGLIQMLAPNDMRARLLSVSSMLSTGIQPLGALWVGWMGNAVGPMATIRVNGLLMAAIALVLLLLHGEFRNWRVARTAAH